MLAVSESTLRRLVKRGEFIAPRKAGKTVRWFRDDVIAWLRGGMQGPSAVVGGQVVQVR
jgi:excisionase family DNA binding protein